MRYKHLAAGLVVLAGLSLSWVVSERPGVAQNTNLPQCPNGIGITKPFSGDTVSGVVTLEATTPNSYGVQSVVFILKDQFTYTGQRTDPYWRVPVDTRASGLGNGAYNLRAKVLMSTTNQTTGTPYECITAPVSFNINNPVNQPAAAKTLEAVPSLQSWSGPTNVSFEVVLKVTLVSGTTRTDISQQATYDWGTTKGVLTPQGYRATVNSGPSSGDGSISVRIKYGDLVKELAIPLKIQPYSATSTYPTVVKSDGTTTATQNPATQDQPKTIQEGQADSLFQTALSKNGQGDAELERCLTNSLGEAEYQERIKQQPRLGYQELTKTGQCFVRRSSVIPSNLAPVEPSKVKSLTVAKNLKLEKFARITKNGKDAIEISGKAEANKTVVVYIFSEPLVIVAKADGNGKWTYVLEDPMEPGNHQAYVTVEGSDSQPVRSSGFGFAVVAAPKTKLNPLGLSFAVQQTSKPRLFIGYYIAAAGVLVLIALVMSVWLVRRRATHINGGDLATAGFGPQNDSKPESSLKTEPTPTAPESAAVEPESSDKPQPPAAS